MKSITLEEWVALTRQTDRMKYPRWDDITPYHRRVSYLSLVTDDGVAYEFLKLLAEEMKQGKPSAVVTISIDETRDAYDLHMSFNARAWTGRVIEYGSHFHDWLNDR